MQPGATPRGTSSDERTADAGRHERQLTRSVIGVRFGAVYGRELDGQLAVIMVKVIRAYRFHALRALRKRIRANRMIAGNPISVTRIGPAL